MSSISRTATAVALVAFCGACRTYEPASLKPRAALEAFLERRADDPGVVALAERLAGSGDGRGPFDPKDGVDADEAEVLALFFNADLRRRRAETGVFLAAADASGAYVDPVFGLDAERILEGVDDPWIVGGTVSVSIPLGGRIGAARAAARSAAVADAADATLAEWTTRRETRRAFHKRAAAGERLKRLDVHLAALAETDELVRRAAESGEIPRIDARLFAVAAANGKAARAEAAAAAVATESELRIFVGLAPDAEVRFVDVLAARPLDAATDATFEVAESRALDLAARRADYDAAEAALAAAIAKATPDLVLSPGLGFEDDMARALLGLALPAPLFDGNRLEIAAATARRAVAGAAFEATLESLYARLAAAKSAADAAAKTRALIETELAPLIDAQIADVRAAAAAGRFDPLVVLKTLEDARDASLKLVDARLAEALAIEQVIELVGPPRASASTEETVR
jgi:outer membrane protein, heavy metal efflux system